MTKRRRSGNSMKRRSNGRYQMKKAMKHGRAKAEYKRNARKNPNYSKGQEIWDLIGSIFVFVIFIYWMSFL